MMAIGYVSIKINPFLTVKILAYCMIHILATHKKIYINAKLTFYGKKQQQQQQQPTKTQTNKPKCIRNDYFLVFAFVEIKYIINHKLHLQGLS